MNQVTGTDLAITTRTGNVSYTDAGTSGIPLIFIHGFPFDKFMWNDQVWAIQNSNRVLTYDIRGFGKSTAGTEPFSMGLFANDLIHFMDAMNISKAVVCGLSMGGYIILNALQSHADRFAGIILCDTQCIADSPETREARSATIEMIEAGKKSEFADGFVKKLFNPATYREKPEVVNVIRNTIMATPDATITGTLKALAARSETCQVLGKIKVPTLIICGESDGITPVEQSLTMLSSISNAVLKVVQNAGHLATLEQPGIVNGHILHFLKGVKR